MRSLFSLLLFPAIYTNVDFLAACIPSDWPMQMFCCCMPHRLFVIYVIFSLPQLVSFWFLFLFLLLVPPLANHFFCFLHSALHRLIIFVVSVSSCHKCKIVVFVVFSVTYTLRLTKQCKICFSTEEHKNQFLPWQVLPRSKKQFLKSEINGWLLWKHQILFLTFYITFRKSITIEKILPGLFLCLHSSWLAKCWKIGETVLGIFSPVQNIFWCSAAGPFCLTGIFLVVWTTIEWNTSAQKMLNDHWNVYSNSVTLYHILPNICIL